jgi:hypothetical protein
MLEGKSVYDRVLHKSQKLNPGPVHKYLTPSKAALYGLMVRFRDPKKGKPAPVE